MSEFPGFGPGDPKPPPPDAATKAWYRLLGSITVTGPKALARSRSYRRWTLRKLR